MLVALAVLIPTALCLPHFPADWVLHNTTYHTSSLLVKVAILLPVGIVYRLKYYFAFYLVQTGVNLTGISWTTGCDYTGVLSGDIRFDIEPNPKKRTEYWNCSIQQWLKLVFYEPIMKATGSSTIALIGTFMISAFWHGIYLTYYLGINWLI